MKKKIKLISIEDVKNDTKEIKINSPRTLKAMHHLNYTNEDLFYYDFKHYRLDKNTKIVGDPVDIQKRKYKLFLEKRKKIIEEIKNLRNEIISKGEDILYIKSKSSSKIIRISRQESKIIKDDEKNIKKEKNKNKSKPKSALNKERKSFVENQIEQEKHVIQNIKKINLFYL